MKICVLILAIVVAGSGSVTGQISSLDRYLEIRALVASKQVGRAEKVIVERLMSEPHDPELLTLLAEVRLDQGRPQEARTLAGNAEHLGGATALRAQISGLASSALGRLDLAEPQFRRAIQLDPKLVAAHYFLARLLYTRNRFDEAIQESKSTIALSPNFVRAYENLGLCYEGKHDLKEAEHWYREAIRINAETIDKTEWPMLDFATMLIRVDRTIEARSYLEQALAINPNNAQSWFQMGILHEKSGEPEVALKQFREAMRFDSKLGGAYYHAARICQKLGDRAEAENYFAKFKEVTGQKH